MRGISNFILPLKTVRGITNEEAEATLEAWYKDRPEVAAWQASTRKEAKNSLKVRTVMGRYRNLPDAKQSGKAGGHALRAAINTPIQVSGARCANYIEFI